MSKWPKEKIFSRKFLENERGYILGMVMIFFIVFSMLGLSFIQMGQHERVHTLKNYNREKAYYYASAGIHKGLWRINKISKASGTFSDATVSVVYDSVSMIMKATGTAGTVQDSIKVTVQSSVGDPTGGWPYVLYNDTKTMKLNEGTGTVTGDVHSNTGVATDAGYTINGTITTSPYVAPPTIDWNFFQTEATNAGQYTTSDKTFDAAGSPYTGVWYTTKKAKIYGNAVINGTIVAVDDLEFFGGNVTITATPSNYPALLCQGGRLKGGNQTNIQITGLVYAGYHFDKDGTDFTITGAVIALTEFHHTSTNFVVTYDANYTTNVAGTDIGGTIPFPTYTIKTWEEL